MKIISLRKNHIDGILPLIQEFEEYLQALSWGSRAEIVIASKKQQILENAFGKNKSYTGYVAKTGNHIAGYIFYHYGFDPDEMRGKVIYIIDLFVSESYRKQGIGEALIGRLCSHEDVIALYAAVWKKNPGANRFYEKLGAKEVKDLPFVKLTV